jgi:ketosteroid isomerase-like protein
MTSIEQAVHEAARRLVEAFGRHDTAAYFDAFAPEASFIFHTHHEVLRDLQAYRTLWATWERDMGLRVRSCVSTVPTVQILGPDLALFHHRVHTVLGTHDGDVTVDERETILFQRRPDGRWLAVHEHLSPAPVLEATV